MHANVGGPGWEGDGGHRHHVLQVEDIDQRIEHESALLADREAARDDEIVLCIHVVDGSRVGIPDSVDAESQGIQNVYSTVRSRSTDIAAPLHEFVVMLGRYLAAISNAPGFEDGAYGCALLWSPRPC